MTTTLPLDVSTRAINHGARAVYRGRTRIGTLTLAGYDEDNREPLYTPVDSRGHNIKCSGAMLRLTAVRMVCDAWASAVGDAS